MKNDTNRIAAIEKAIKDKYGAETIQNPHANWDEDKEKKHIKEVDARVKKIRKREEHQEKVDINGIKISKKLLNSESLTSCPVCGIFPKISLDDVCFVKFECCHNCYIQYIEGREERWLKGWRPNNGNSL